MEELNSVQKFYANKTIFITGASGFMGKVLLEKLLYSCSEIKEVIILMRPKKGSSEKERVKTFECLALFKRIMKEKSEVMNKISPVYGDISKHNFGLSPKHLEKVLSCQIMFHLAASLRNEAPLKVNVTANMIGTKNALDVAQQMKCLIHMVHLSTAFCNVEANVAYEVMYPHPNNPEDILQLNEWMSEGAMTAVQEELLNTTDCHPSRTLGNTYVYTKRLAEIMVEREFKKGLPVSIARPSCVLPASVEPCPGWVDSLNGAVGIFYAAGKGVLRSMLVDEASPFEYIPVDIAIAALIMMPKLIVTGENQIELPIYHITVPDSDKKTIGELFRMTEVIGRNYPVSWALWYPDGSMTTNRLKHAVRVFLFQLVPAYIIDFLLVCFKQKRFMVNVQRRIANGCEVLAFYTKHSWRFNCDKFQSMSKLQSPSEQDMFSVDCMSIKDKYKYIENCLLGGREYVLSDPPSTLPLARTMNKIQYVLHVACRILFYWFLASVLIRIFLGIFEYLSVNMPKCATVQYLGRLN